MWKSVVESDRPQMTIWCMHIACLVTKATNKHTQCVINIASQQQQWLHERYPVLRHTYIARHIHLIFVRRCAYTTCNLVV